MNKVSVNIYDDDYTIIGEEKQDHIGKIAAHVDQRMREIGNALRGGVKSDVAVLTAVNIALEYFDREEQLNSLAHLNEQLEAESRHYVQLWEEAKASFLDYKEDSQLEIKNFKQRIEEMNNYLAEKDRELEEMLRNQKKMEKEALQGSEVAIEKMEEKYKELENNYFDLQMENIQLKSELEKIKSKLEWEKNE